MLRSLLLALALMPTLAVAQTICIDPGHPSEVGIGTRGKKSTEVQVAWDIAIKLRNRLRKEGFAVVMTKQSVMQKVSNEERADIANRHNSDLLVRLHCDASSLRGFAVYYPSQKGTVRGIHGPSEDVLDKSKYRATIFYQSMASALKGKLPNQGLKTDLHTAIGGKQGALTGSIISNVPVLLVEMVVLTNAQDEAFILSKKGSEQMVNALAKGVISAVKK